MEVVKPLKRVYPKFKVNHECSCGSGKKYKRCHGRDEKFVKEANYLETA